MKAGAKLLGLDQIAKEPLPEVEWLVEGVLGLGDRAVLAGEWGSLKTWLSLHLSIHLALGRDWLGHKVEKPRRVLYIDEEMPEWGMRSRAIRILQAEGIPLDHPLLSNLKFVSRQGFKLDIQNIMAVKALCLTWDPEVVILETLVRVMKGNENSNSEVADAWNLIGEHLQAGSKRTVLITHHFRKPSQETDATQHLDIGHMIRGGGDIVGGGDAIMVSLKVMGGSRVVSVKPRMSEPFDPFTLCLYLKPPTTPEEKALFAEKCPPEKGDKWWRDNGPITLRLVDTAVKPSQVKGAAAKTGKEMGGLFTAPPGI